MSPRAYATNWALSMANQPVVKFLSPLCFSIGATANSQGILLSSGTLSNGSKPNYLLIAPEVDCRFQFDAAVDASTGGVLRANQVYSFGVHIDVDYVNAIQTSGGGLAHLTFLY